MVGIGTNNPGIQALLARFAGLEPSLYGGGAAQDPLSQLLGYLAQASQAGPQAGAGQDPRMLRRMLARLDRSIVERLLSGGLSGMPGSSLGATGLGGAPFSGAGLFGPQPGAGLFGPQPGASLFGPQPGAGLFGPQPGASLFGPQSSFGCSTGQVSPFATQLPFNASCCFPMRQMSCFPGALGASQQNLCWPQGSWGLPGSSSSSSSSSSPGGPRVGKTFDVWFESKDGQNAVQRSPIVLDLNGNGRPDLTGNVGVENGRWVAKGAGKVDFDIDPSKRSWANKSVARRPGKGAPAVPGGYAKVFDDKGALLEDKVPLDRALGKGGGKGGIQTGRAEVYDQGGQLVGEYKKDAAKNQMMYHYGNRKDAEKTEWMAPGGADGLLVWDTDNNGKIESSKELFGEFDVDGQKKFSNGYQKLGAYFDVNGDGVVAGAELSRAQASGVKVWRDVNGDGKTDAGELQGLDQHGIRALGTRVDGRDMSSAYVAR